MACLSARGSSNGELLRKASAAAREHDGEFYAVFVDSPRTRFGNADVRRRSSKTPFSPATWARKSYGWNRPTWSASCYSSPANLAWAESSLPEIGQRCSLDYLAARSIPIC